MQEDQREQIAYHEAGHAVALHHFRPEHRIVRATIIGRGGGTLGYVQPVPKYEEYAIPLRILVADIMVSLAGHVATKVFLGEYWTGAYSDFDKVRSRIVHLSALGYFGPPLKQPGNMFSAGEFAGREKEIEGFWNSLEDQCERFIQTKARAVDAVARALLDKESLTGDEVAEIIEQAQKLQEVEENEFPELVSPNGESSTGSDDEKVIDLMPASNPEMPEPVNTESDDIVLNEEED